MILQDLLAQLHGSLQLFGVDQNIGQAWKLLDHSPVKIVLVLSVVVCLPSLHLYSLFICLIHHFLAQQFEHLVVLLYDYLS